MFEIKQSELDEIIEYEATDLLKELEDTIEKQTIYLEDMKQYSIVMTNRYMETLVRLLDDRITKLEKTIDNYKSLE